MRIIVYLFIYLVYITQSYATDIIDHVKVDIKNLQGQILIESNKEISPFIFRLDNPSRLVIDLKNFSWKKNHSKTSLDKENKIVSNIRYGIQNGYDLRIVLDLLTSINILSKHSKRISKDHYIFTINFNSLSKQKNYIPVIVIDPGHGGIDPGTKGVISNIFEKNITLDYAKSLKEILDKQKLYKTILTRENDKYLPLEARVQKAQRNKADLFISLHADAHQNPLLKGASIYTLSEHASDEEAEKLALQENHQVQKIIKKDNNNSDISHVLIDLLKRDMHNNSIKFANLTIHELEKNIDLLKNTHRSASFKVLKLTEIPAVLIELGYLSNKEEELLVLSKAYRLKVSNSIAKAIGEYFRERAIK